MISVVVVVVVFILYFYSFTKKTKLHTLMYGKRNWVRIGIN